MEVFLIIAVFAGFIIIAGIAAHRKQQARISELSAWARSRQLYFEPGKVHGFDDLHPGISCLQQGDGRYAFNIVSGTRGEYEMTAFDYHYETESTDSDGDTSTTHHYFSAVLLQPRHPLKPLLIRREGFFDRIKAGFGFNDIDFESAEFSKRFHVTAADKRWAYDVIHARTMELILGHPTDRTLEFDDRLLCIAAEEELNAFEFEQAYKYGAAILDGIPDYARATL